MARQRRSFLVGTPYHVVQRASHRAFILDDDQDRAALVGMIRAWQDLTGVKIASYVIMGNHFHLIVQFALEDALSRFMGGLCAEYSRYYNAKRGRRGPNWQTRFFGAPMDEEHTVMAIRYVERNPLAAGMVGHPCDWHWSTAAAHCGLGPLPQIVNLDLRPKGLTSRQWREFLETPLDADFCARFKAATSMGRALGAPEWAAKIDREMGRPEPLRGRSKVLRSNGGLVA